MDFLSLSSGPLPPTFSLQDALSPLGASSPDIILFADGCNQTDGTKNCTATCLDSTQAFRTLESLHNCLYYIGIAAMYAHQTLSSNDAKVVDDLMIQKSEGNSSPSQNINSTITACFDTYCHGRRDCMEFISTTLWISPTNTYEFPYAIDIMNYGDTYFTDILCEYITNPVTLNADIGGIGVYASYWIQSGLALLGTFLVLLWGWGIHYVYDPIMVRRRGSSATKPPQDISATFKNRRLAHITAAMADFQKAQCFFILAVNIAALANKVNGGLLPVSLQQLYDNYSLLSSVATSGYLPITTTLLALHMVDMISRYLLVLSGSTVALSIATLAAIGIFKPSRGDLESIQAQALKGTQGYCGSFDLSVYCLQHDDLNYTYVWGIMAYCLVVLLFIFAYHLNAFKDRSNNEVRPWVLFMASYMSSVRPLQFVLGLVTIILLLNEIPWWIDSGFVLELSLASVTLAYAALEPLCRLRCARRIKYMGSISIRCGFDLLLSMSWLADFVVNRNPLSFCIWMTFIISTVHLLRKAYIEETHIRKWILKYQHIAYRDETLPTLSLGNRSIRTRLRRSSTTIMKASIILATLLSKPIDKLEKRAASHDWPRKFRRFLLICLYWTMFSGCIVSFFFVFQGLASFQAKIDMHTWTFGQIVAITVWAPPLCEYFHLELRGMTRGFQHRLLPPYRILAMVTPPPPAQPVP